MGVLFNGWFLVMSSKMTPVVVRHLLGPLGMFGHMAGTSQTHIYTVAILQTVTTEGTAHL